jgi:hypothetical protein
VPACEEEHTNRVLSDASPKVVILAACSHNGPVPTRLAAHRRRRRVRRYLLPPSSGPTQVGTTLSLTFRAMIGADGGEVEMVVAL